MSSSLSLEVLYASSYHLYRNGKYQEAVHAFRVLTLQDPKEKKFWMGLGASYQMLNEQDLAIQCYACASTLAPEDPMPHLYAAECFLAKKEEAPATEAWTLAETLSRGREDEEKIRTKLALIKRTCSNRSVRKKEETRGSNQT